MANKFKVGDVVVLKSGGPPMTIAEAPTGGRGSYHCRWFKGATPAQGIYIEGILDPYARPSIAEVGKK